jgi:hypothetical protein
MKLKLIQRPSSDESKVASEVAHAKPEEKSRNALVEVSQDDSIERISPRDLVTVHPIGPFFRKPQEITKFPDIVLTVPVAIEDKILGGSRKTGPKSRPVSLILCV